MFIRSIRIFLILSLSLVLLTCGFEADKSLLSSGNSMDINVRCGSSTVYDGQGFYIGIVNSGTTKDFTFTIENIGSGGSLELTGIPIVSISGTGFSILTQPDKTALAPGEKTNFTVHFAPTAVQAYQGIVTILNNDIGESEYAFGLLSENFVLPNAPSVTGLATTNNTKPEWTWTSGGNGSGTFRFKLDSSDLTTGATETTETSFIPPTPIPPGNHVLYVQEQDTGGKFWSIYGSFATNVRLNPPTVSGTTSPTANTKPTWTWSTGNDGNGTFRYKLDSSDFSTGATITTDTSFTPANPIPPGYHYLYVQEQEINQTYWSSTASYGINIRFRPPIITWTSAANDTTPSWTLTPGGDGNGTFRCKIDSSDFSSGAIIITGSVFDCEIPIPPGSHSIYAQEQDSSGLYWSQTGSNFINIVHNSPVVTGIDATSEERPEWTWISGGGNEYYRYKLDSNDFSSGSTETSGNSYIPVGSLTAGNHTLYVQERDINGAFWSQSGSFTSSIKMMSAVGWIGGGSDGWKKTNGASTGNGYQNFYGPNGLFIDTEGNIYIADCKNNRIMKWDQNGKAIGWIGGGSNGWKTTSGALSGNSYQNFYKPSAVFVDVNGNIYVADNYNHRVSKWNIDGNAIGWIGGGSNGWKTTSGASSGNGYQSFYYPNRLFLDSSENIYIVDGGNHRISKWNADGNAIGWIGGGGNGWKTTSGASSGNGYQSFNGPSSVIIDTVGNIYVADDSNHRISKWDANGNAIGWIGGGSNGWKTTSGASSGNGYQSFYNTSGVFVDNSGYIFIADILNYRISKWDVSGNAIGWIGGGSNGWKTISGASSGNGYQSFYNPSVVFVTIYGDIYIADIFNNRISKWHQY